MEKTNLIAARLLAMTPKEKRAAAASLRKLDAKKGAKAPAQGQRTKQRKKSAKKAAKKR
jgi:hypothetical protein